MHLASEPGLRDAFLGLSGEKTGVTVEGMAARVADSLNKVGHKFLSNATMFDCDLQLK